jgi:hypothetical protein
LLKRIIVSSVCIKLLCVQMENFFTNRVQEVLVVADDEESLLPFLKIII